MNDAKTDGPRNVAFFRGLNELPAKLLTLKVLEETTRALVAEAYTRGFSAGFDAGKAGT